MLLRLKLYRLLLKIAVYVLPFLAFQLGWRIWALCLASIERRARYSVDGHFTLVLIGAFLWAVMAEYYKVTSVDELFRERNERDRLVTDLKGKARTLGSALDACLHEE